MVDLGAWVSESYRISGEDALDEEDSEDAGEDEDAAARLKH